MPDCEEIVFDVNENKNKLNPKLECDYYGQGGSELREDDFQLLFGEKLRHTEGEEFYRMITYLNNNADMDHSKGVLQSFLLQNMFYRYMSIYMMANDCIDSLEQDFAFVTIEVGKPHLKVRMKRDISVSFVSKVGTFGE